MRTVFDDEIDVSERGEVGDELTVLRQGSGEQPLEDVQADDDDLGTVSACRFDIGSSR